MDDEYTPDPDAFTCTECGDVCYTITEHHEGGCAWLPYTETFSACCEAEVVPTYK